jgi:hypothetical protein
LPPSLATSQNFGLGLENLGYYKVINDYWDVTTRTNIYTYGGWMLDVRPEYFKRYKYRGNFDVTLQKTKTLNETGISKDEFTEYNTFKIQWSHSTDPRAHPGTSFSASVNASSTKFNQTVTNNPVLNYQNQQTSSITWSKVWNQGKYNLSVAGNHNQNNLTHLISLNVPTVNFSATTIYPFQKKEFIGKPKWYEKLGVSYTGTLITQSSFYDTLPFSFKHLVDTTQYGVDHRIPITLTLPSIGPIIPSPSVSYEERWYAQQINLAWNDKTKKVDTTLSRGLFAAREVNLGFSTSTRIFGMFNFGKNGWLRTIRHTITPTVSLNYKPDLVGKYYSTIQIDSAGNHYRYSKFAGGVMGSFSEGKFGGINFGIDNMLEAKVRDSKDTSGLKKIKLIDGLGINTGYNFFADSLKWSPVTINARSTLFDKVNITAGATIDPYNADSLGRRINQLLWSEGKFGRFTNANFALSTSLKSKSKDDRKDQDRLTVDETLTPDEQQRQLDYVRSNPAEFVDFNNPWTLQLSYVLNLTRVLSSDFKSYKLQINSNVNINGDFSLSPKWKAGGSTYFDFRTLKIQAVNLFLTREMHCWQMAINIMVGSYKSFGITLNPKSGILRDLKINRVRSYSTY